MINADDGEAGAAGSSPGQVLAIRDRTESDLDECVRVLAEVHRRDGYPMHWPADPHRWLYTPKIFAAWVATVDGQVAGHAGLSVITPGDAAPRLLSVTSPRATPNGAAVGGGIAAGGSGGAAGGSGVTGGGAAGSGEATRSSGTAGGGLGVAGSSGAVDGGLGVVGSSGAAGSGAAVMLSRLFVSASARGHGAGSALVHQAMQAARERGLHLLLDVHSANTSAIALYERLGWNFLGASHARWGPDQVTVLSYTAPA